MFTARYTVSKQTGIYIIDCFIGGAWECGGTTGVSDYGEAYIVACKVAKTKGYQLDRFYADIF